MKIVLKREDFSRNVMVYGIGEKEYDFFERNSLVASLEACESAGYSPIFMPEFADLRISHPELFKDWGRSMSIRASGRTSAGSAVEIYAHVPGPWSQREYISDMIYKGNLINTTLPLPQEAFDALVERDGDTDHGTRLVTVMDHAKANIGKFREQSIEQALANPHVHAFLGGEKQAKAYLEAHKNVNGNKIWFYYSDDLGAVPVARTLVLSSYILLGSSYDFYNYRRVPGVRLKRNGVGE